MVVELVACDDLQDAVVLAQVEAEPEQLGVSA